MPSLLHDALSERAKRWLKNTIKCQCAFKELDTPAGEYPDAFGIKDGITFLIEVKVSVQDFRADQKKKFRQHGGGIGMVRWYMTPPALLDADLIPEGWGLLESNGHSVKVIKGITPQDHLYAKMEPNEFIRHERDACAELYILATHIRRIEKVTGDSQTFLQQGAK